MERTEAVVDLSTSLLKAALKAWAGPIALVADSISDLVRQRVEDKLKQRRIERFFEVCVDIVARKLVEQVKRRRVKIEENEVVAAVLAARDTFDAAKLSASLVVKGDLDPRLIYQSLEPLRAEALSRAGLSEQGEQLYDFVMIESCSYMVEVITTLPKFENAAFGEILRRETRISETLDRVLASLPERRGVDDFAADYRRLVVNRFDRMELFGVRLSSEAGRSYPLSVAYVSLNATSGRPAPPDRLTAPAGSPAGRRGFTGGRWRSKEAPAASPRTAGKGPVTHPAVDAGVEEVLSKHSRILIVGEAGSGKTTLLHWLAVRAAQRDFEGHLVRWNQYMPFYIPLRRYADERLPSPEDFPSSVSQHIAAEMPDSWVHEALRGGDGLVLIDGVDELQDGTARTVARRWLADLVSAFPHARYVITSRPAAINEDWLSPLAFQTAELLPMAPSSVRMFVGQWHDAMYSELADGDGRERLRGDQAALLSAIEADRHLRALCVNPLLCALLCALNRERRRHLPRNRMGVYRAALEMLIDLRDKERGVGSHDELDLEAKTVLLQDLALFLVRNGWSDAPIERVESQLARSLRTLSGVSMDAPEVLRVLLERSGLLRRPALDRIDFVHRSFQEYLAGKAAVDNDQIGYLAKHGSDDQLRDVVIMAVGHALPRQRAELLHEFLTQSRQARKRGRPTDLSDKFELLAIACLQTATQLDPSLRADIESLANKWIPPQSVDVAPALAAIGDAALDMLRRQPPRSRAEAIASIRVATLVGGPEAVNVIAEIAASHDGIDDEIVRAWGAFEPALFAEHVLPVMGSTRSLTVADIGLLPYLHHLDALRDLSISSSEFTSFRLAPVQMSRIERLRISGSSLRGLDGIEEWSGLVALDLSTGGNNLRLHPLRALRRLESLRLYCGHSEILDLSPLGDLPSLRVLHVDQANGKFLRLHGLSSIDHLTITVPEHLNVVGANSLGRGAKVVRSDVFPQLW